MDSHVIVTLFLAIVQSACVRSQDVVSPFLSAYRVTDFGRIDLTVNTSQAQTILQSYPNGSALYIQAAINDYWGFECGPVSNTAPFCSMTVKTSVDPYDLRYRVDLNGQTVYTSPVVEVVSMTARVVLSPPEIEVLEANSTGLDVAFSSWKLSGLADNWRVLHVRITCVEPSCKFREKQFELDGRSESFSYNGLDPSRKWLLELWNTSPGSIYQLKSQRDSFNSTVRLFSTSDRPFFIKDYLEALIISVIILMLLIMIIAFGIRICQRQMKLKRLRSSIQSDSFIARHTAELGRQDQSQSLVPTESSQVMTQALNNN